LFALEVLFFGLFFKKEREHWVAGKRSVLML
jgi:hypothetical protein